MGYRGQFLAIGSDPVRVAARSAGIAESSSTLDQKAKERVERCCEIQNTDSEIYSFAIFSMKSQSKEKLAIHCWFSSDFPAMDANENRFISRGFGLLSLLEMLRKSNPFSGSFASIPFRKCYEMGAITGEFSPVFSTVMLMKTGHWRVGFLRRFPCSKCQCASNRNQKTPAEIPPNDSSWRGWESMRWTFFSPYFKSLKKKSGQCNTIFLILRYCIIQMRRFGSTLSLPRRLIGRSQSSILEPERRDAFILGILPFMARDYRSISNEMSIGRGNLV